jgi:hypothetical protein
VANKLISMFLHELSRSASKNWPIKVESETYGALVREAFENRCPYCLIDLRSTTPVVEHLDGMNRYRVGLHVADNVLIACRRCNSEKRRDDSLLQLVLADSGWESFLSHNGNCVTQCKTCAYWKLVWPVGSDRSSRLSENLERIRVFRSRFPEFEAMRVSISLALPGLVTKLYSDCQDFAEDEIRKLLLLFAESPQVTVRRPSGDDIYSPKRASVKKSSDLHFEHPTWGGCIGASCTHGRPTLRAPHAHNQPSQNPELGRPRPRITLKQTAFP